MAPPQIKRNEIIINLAQPRLGHACRPIPVASLQAQLDTYQRQHPNGHCWNPRTRGQMARPASSDWLETASAMEKYVRSGESARDMADFALGEAEGCAKTLKATAHGAAQLVFHPVQSATQVRDAVVNSGPALSEFSKHSDEIMANAIRQKWSHFVNASSREQGQITGSGLTEVGLTLAPMPKLSVVTKGMSKVTARFLPKGQLASKLSAIPRKLQTGARELTAMDWDKAEAIYDTIRQTSGDVERISQATGIRPAKIQRIKDHLFHKLHQLDEGLARFDADPMIANAWKRLENGIHLPKDLQLLEHELFESRFEGIFKTNYRTAHEAANRSGRLSGLEY